MGWYSIDVTGNEQQQLQKAVSELFFGVKVLESFRHVYSDAEKKELDLDYDAVSYHAAKIKNTDEVRALVVLERHQGEVIDYRPYTEQACPGEASCPRSILDKLSPTQNDLAIEWRERAYGIAEEIEEGKHCKDLLVSVKAYHTDIDSRDDFFIYKSDDNKIYLKNEAYHADGELVGAGLNKDAKLPEIAHILNHYNETGDWVMQFERQGRIFSLDSYSEILLFLEDLIKNQNSQNIDTEIQTDSKHRELVRDYKGNVMGLRLDENQVIRVEKFEGELDGRFATLWVAVDKNAQFYTTSSRELKETAEGMKVGYDITVWKSISNERHCQITEEMHKVREVTEENNFKSINNNQTKKTIMETQEKKGNDAVKKSLAEIKEMFGGLEKIKLFILKPAEIKEKKNSKDELWMTGNAIVYHKDSKQNVFVNDINFNGKVAEDFKQAIAEGARNFVVSNVKFGEIKDQEGGYQQMNIFANKIDSYERSVKISGQVTKLTPFENSTKALVFESVGGADVGYSVMVSKNEFPGLELKTGAVKVEGNLSTKFDLSEDKSKVYKNTTLWPDKINDVLSVKAQEKEKKKEAVKNNVSEGKKPAVKKGKGMKV